MLECRNLTVRYGHHLALDQVSVSVDRGEVVVILGANGAGKSTLLNTVAGLLRAVSGDILLDGKTISGTRSHQIVDSGITLVPEGRSLFGELTVMENLVLGAHPQHARAVFKDNLERVFSIFPKLQERKNQIAQTMSGGEQQMVAVGRAMMSAPSILMLDEPSLGLSPILCVELFRALKTIRETGVGILLVEQNAKQSLNIADRGYVLTTGAITAKDRAQSLIKDPAVLKAYLGENHLDS